MDDRYAGTLSGTRAGCVASRQRIPSQENDGESVADLLDDNGKAGDLKRAIVALEKEKRTTYFKHVWRIYRQFRDEATRTGVVIPEAMYALLLRHGMRGAHGYLLARTASAVQKDICEARLISRREVCMLMVLYGQAESASKLEQLWDHACAVGLGGDSAVREAYVFSRLYAKIKRKGQDMMAQQLEGFYQADCGAKRSKAEARFRDAVLAFCLENTLGNARAMWNRYCEFAKTDVDAFARLPLKWRALIIDRVRDIVNIHEDVPAGSRYIQRIWKDYRRSAATGKFRIHSYEYPKFISVFIRTRLFERCRECYKHAAASGHARNPRLLLAMLHCSLEQGNDTAAGKFLQKLQETEQMPISVYSVLIAHYASRGEMARAFEAYQQVSLSELRPGLHMYRPLINACLRAEDPQWEEQMPGLLGDMESWNLQPDATIFGAIATGYTMSGRYDLALHLVNRLARSGMRLTPGIYHAKLAALAHFKQVNEMVQTVDEMRQKSVPITRRILTTVTAALSQHGRLDEALKFAGELQRMGVAGVPEACTTILSTQLRHALQGYEGGNIRAAKDAMLSIQSAAIEMLKSDRKSVHSPVLVRLLQAVDIILGRDAMYACFDRLSEQGAQLSAYAYKVMIENLTYDGGESTQRAVALFPLYLEKLVADDPSSQCELTGPSFNALFAALLATNDFNVVLDIYWLLLELGIPHASLPYDALLAYAFEHDTGARTSEIFELSRNAIQADVRVNPEIFTKLVMFLVDQRLFHNIPMAFRYAHRTSLLKWVSAGAWEPFVEACLSGHCELQEFSELFVKRASIPRFLPLWRWLIALLVDRGAVSVAVEICLQIVGTTDCAPPSRREKQQAICQLINILRQKGLVDEGIAFWHALHKLDAPINDFVYNAVMHLLAARPSTTTAAAAVEDKGGRQSPAVVVHNSPERRLELLWSTITEMHRRNITPAFSSYYHAATYYAHHGTDPQRSAFTIIDNMREHGLAPTASLFTSVLHGYLVSKQPKMVQQLLLYIEASDIMPTTAIYTLILQFIAEQRSSTLSADALWSAFEQMVAQGFRPNNRTFAVILRAMVRLRDIDGFNRALQEMARHGIGHDLISVTETLNFYALNYGLEVAAKYFRYLLDYNRLTSSLRAPPIEIRPVRDRILVASDIPQWKSPNIYIYNIMLRLYLAHDHIETAFELIEQMTKLWNIKPNVVTYTILLQYLAASSNHASHTNLLAIWSLMKQAGIQPDKVAKETLHELLTRT
ncbi:hypothetical protein EV182_002065 [Spiromyces aspiralis]|uniref:Uncharacterized protein n=1 Tax=Spiromyces aspiralis TaxID=68401 RepID=A0ACC1HWF7_9FUNG|nr:hypothetical protein EV182_002065 [Spiromyces aspiralis]